MARIVHSRSRMPSMNASLKTCMKPSTCDWRDVGRRAVRSEALLPARGSSRAHAVIATSPPRRPSGRPWGRMDGRRPQPAQPRSNRMLKRLDCMRRIPHQRAAIPPPPFTPCVSSGGLSAFIRAPGQAANAQQTHLPWPSDRPGSGSAGRWGWAPRPPSAAACRGAMP